MISRENADVAGAYDIWSETYDIDANRTRSMAAEVLRAHEFNVRGRRVVEVGCGTGLNTLRFYEQGGTVLGLDFSAGMLVHARRRVASPRVQFVQHDIRDPWPAETRSTDLVVAMLVLEHIENLDPIYAEAARVLRADGDFFVCELHPMRQLIGRQAAYTNPETGRREPIAAFLHTISEYVNTGIRQGLRLIEMGEWCDADAATGYTPRKAPPDAPRLMSAYFKAPPPSGHADAPALD